MYTTSPTDLMAGCDHGGKGVHPEGYLLHILRVVGLYAHTVAVVVVDVEAAREEATQHDLLIEQRLCFHF